MSREEEAAHTGSGQCTPKGEAGVVACEVDTSRATSALRVWVPPMAGAPENSPTLPATQHCHETAPNTGTRRATA
eukprot:5313415-Alexandrium_andersonii.AAC.1